MCGIGGLWNYRGPSDPSGAVASMLEAMHHRGPDGRGQVSYEGGSAGMVRLALVDLSDRGQQPLWSADRRVAILFNGEIYNFRAERQRLSDAGVTFQSQTDTEVILQLYLERGLEFVDRLRGMYAIALFDWRETSPGALPKLVLVRGPLGIKPLYIAQIGRDGMSSNGSSLGNVGTVLFASELRGLMATGLLPKDIDRQSLAQYLAHGFVLQPRTIFAGARMMEPGTIEEFLPDGRHNVRRFWQTPPYAPRQETLNQAAERLRSVLEESIALHAFADAPVGAFLSGGVDSTGIVGLMRPHVPDLRTFTLRCPDVGHQDETDFAIETARSLGCRSTIVDVTGPELPELLPQFAASLDQPSGDGLNTWLISRAAGRQVKAVLSGVGGDEWFAGYPVARRMAYRATAGGKLVGAAAQLAMTLAKLLPESRLRQRAWNLGSRRSMMAIWLQAHRVFETAWARRAAGLRDAGEADTEWFRRYLGSLGDDVARETPLGLACLLDFQVYMRCQLLRDSDVTSMAHSLELRTPFVDVEVVNFSRSCSDRFKLNTDGGFSGLYGQSGAKRVLIHALRDILPSDMDQRPKLGFALPYRQWVTGDLYSLVCDTCSPRAVAAGGLIDPDLVAPLTRDRATIGANARPRLWTLMMLELWRRATFESRRPAAVAAA